MREVLSGRGLREKTQTPFIPYRIPTGVPMRVGFGICQGRRLCRLRDGNGWRCLWAPGWARAHGQRGAKPLSKCVICQYNRQRSFLSVSSASTTARGATTRTEVMRAGSNMGSGTEVMRAGCSVKTGTFLNSPLSQICCK